MTTLQEIVATIKALPITDQRAVISEFSHLIVSNEGVFELTMAELAELAERTKNDTVMFTPEEVMKSLRENHAAGTSTQ